MTAETLVWLLLAHGIGDYILQSHWMATEKTQRWWPAIAHGATYGLPFIPLVPSPWAWLVITGTHAVIDRYRLARFVTFAKNKLAPAGQRPAWRDCCPATGFPSGMPAWLATALLFIVDNLMHVLINIAAVAWL